MRRASETSRHHPETGSGRIEFALIVAAIILATVATYLALSKKMAVAFGELAVMLGFVN
jgi:Flp pilus assembly pilin Flp